MSPVWLPDNEKLFFVNCYWRNWDEFLNVLPGVPDQIALGDHLFGFDNNYRNRVYDALQQQAESSNRTWTVLVDQIYSKQVHDNYPRIKLKFRLDLFERYGAVIRMPPRHEYGIHPDIDFRNFLCSFNGKYAVSRKLLLAALKKFNWFNKDYVSKHPVWEPGDIDGLIQEFVGSDEAVYRKFFDLDDQEFGSLVNSFGYERGKHDVNIYNLEHKLTQSFVHLVSETIATSSVPFVTEKSFYSIITRGLFLTYGQPLWHRYMSDVFGFKKYTKLFDYRFDQIKNPIVRLIEILCMLSKYSNLSTFDWHDLYQQELDSINFNYEHFYSKDFVRHLDNYHQENVYFLTN